MNEEENKKEKNVKETKIDILKSILSEVTIFKNKVTSLETSLYKKEQVDEAAAAEAYLETEPDKKEAIKIGTEKDQLKEEPEEKEKRDCELDVGHSRGRPIQLELAPGQRDEQPKS